LREAIEKPGTTAALVTQDRALAQRVSAELLRFDVIADDSAGEPLPQTPVFVFLRLLLQACDLRPIHLLALLKHPYAAFGLTPAHCRNQSRTLETQALRGPKPAANFEALRARHADPDFLARIEQILAPLINIPPSAPAEFLLRSLLLAAEAAAKTDESEGAEILWSGEDGESLAAHLSELFLALPHLPTIRLKDLAPLLVASANHLVVRSQRALRGRTGALHPRIFIWGVLEARLQTADLIVLGGLSESIWPGLADPGPWVNREMRTRIGLPSPEESIGAESLDFSLLTCAAPRVILSTPQKREGAPAVPARWLARLNAFQGKDFALPTASCAVWANDIDQPPEPPKAAVPPSPCPPLERRPRKLSVTEIETLLLDPYAIHARHILKLKALDPIEEPADHSDYGTLVHEALTQFSKRYGPNLPPDPITALQAVFTETLDDKVNAAQLRPALAAWWRPRLMRIAAWIASEAEPAWREGILLSAQFCEQPGRWEFSAPNGMFTLTARADRIDQRQSDHQISILDYKTGSPPSQKAVAAGYAPQLPLEAAMLAHGAFGDIHGSVKRLAYWRITGGHPAGEQTILFKKNLEETGEIIENVENKVRKLIISYDDPAKPYPARPIQGKSPRFSDYAQLERVALWANAEDEPEDSED